MLLIFLGQTSVEGERKVMYIPQFLAHLAERVIEAGHYAVLLTRVVQIITATHRDL